MTDKQIIVILGGASAIALAMGLFFVTHSSSPLVSSAAGADVSPALAGAVPSVAAATHAPNQKTLGTIEQMKLAFPKFKFTEQTDDLGVPYFTALPPTPKIRMFFHGQPNALTSQVVVVDCGESTTSYEFGLLNAFLAMEITVPGITIGDWGTFGGDAFRSFARTKDPHVERRWSDRLVSIDYVVCKDGLLMSVTVSFPRN